LTVILPKKETLKLDYWEVLDVEDRGVPCLVYGCILPYYIIV